MAEIDQKELNKKALKDYINKLYPLKNEIEKVITQLKACGKAFKDGGYLNNDQILNENKLNNIITALQTEYDNLDTIISNSLNN